MDGRVCVCRYVATKIKEQVCVLLDNCKAHDVSNLKLSHVVFEYLPPNTTSVLQPLDMVSTQQKLTHLHLSLHVLGACVSRASSIGSSGST